MSTPLSQYKPPTQQEIWRNQAKNVAKADSKLARSQPYPASVGQVDKAKKGGRE